LFEIKPDLKTSRTEMSQCTAGMEMGMGMGMEMGTTKLLDLFHLPTLMHNSFII
jgi:hypothetical protein